MLNNLNVYYFSPTGGTRKIAEELGKNLSKSVNMVDLCNKDFPNNEESDLIIVAAPVFSGRIPGFVTAKLEKLAIEGKKAVTLIVYGNRAYEDALLELNDTLKKKGCLIISSGVFVAQHSLAPEIAKGRPEETDLAEVRNYARDILKKLDKAEFSSVTVPGNFPYKEIKKSIVTPISTDMCNKCGECARVCPVEAISIKGSVETDPGKCFLCASCIKVCPMDARILPPPLSEGMKKMAEMLKNTRNGNEIFI